MPSGWEANLTLPWAVIAPEAAGRPAHARVNLYRMDYTVSDGAVAKTAMAWAIPDCAGSSRCNPEHTPNSFGVARFV